MAISRQDVRLSEMLGELTAAILHFQFIPHVPQLTAHREIATGLTALAMTGVFTLRAAGRSYRTPPVKSPEIGNLAAPS